MDTAIENDYMSLISFLKFMQSGGTLELDLIVVLAVVEELLLELRENSPPGLQM